ncbi:type II secretion system minor pseudopilin GspI [Alkalimarinus coralli]|uniref:type II secretion system minor pseudopilin GspI n=1 Tax=Alkalimarinus coralli TaxID=2935863 RepID=UPI00202B6D5A|nr:type II secretion system minor pseudopilin GspI [Alkalimarinus coralli]
MAKYKKGCVAGYGSKKTFSKTKGFTLLEVMVAVTIFVFVAAVILKATSQNIAQYERIRLKMMANWIAENKMAEVRLSEGLPQARESKQDIEFANEHWKLVSKVTKTENPFVNRVDLVIFHKLSDDQFEEGNQVLTFSGYAGLH